MRIVIDARMLGWSGVGRYSRHLLDELQTQDKTNQYLVLLNSADFKTWQPSAKNFQKILSPYRPYSLGEQLGLAWQLYRLKPQLVHFLSFSSPVLYLGQRMATIHDLTMIDFRNYHGGPIKRLVTWLKYWPMRFNLRCIVRRSKALITPSVFVKKEVLRRWGKDVFYEGLKNKIHVTYESSDKLGSKSQTVSRLKDAKFLLYVGNAYPHKNLGNLIEAFRIINLQQPELKLALVGSRDEYYQKLEGWVARQGIANIEFLGRAGDQHLVWLYRHALCFVLPSLSEGFGLPGLEAMAYGLPVAAAKASSLPEVYGEAAVYFNPSNPGDIAQAAMQIIDSPSLRAKLVKNGQRQVNKYSWQKMAAETLGVYRRVIK